MGNGDDLMATVTRLQAGAHAPQSTGADEAGLDVSAPRTFSLDRVLQNLGSTMLELLLGDPEPVGDVRGIVIYDQEEVLRRGALILAIAAHSSAEVVAIMDRAAASAAGALVVRTPFAVDDEIRAAVERTGIPLLGLVHGASWTQLALLLGSMLGLRSSITTARETELPSTDLFALANVVSSLLDAPITIEDRNSQVLAFSSGQDDADQARYDTIIGRKVPANFTRAYHAQGVFKQLYRQPRPVYVEPLSTEELPRVAVAIRAGNEILGSIWAAVRGPLSPEREQAFVDGARLVALHMLRQTAASDISRRLKAARVMTLLDGGPGVAEAARALGLSQPAVVWAWGHPPVASSPSLGDAEAERQRVMDTLTFHVSSLHPWGGVAASGDTTYVLLPVSPRAKDAESDSVRIAQALLDRTAHQFHGVIGVSKVAATPSSIARARKEADRALRVLRSRRAAGAAGGISELDLDALLLEMRDLARENGYEPSAPLQRMLRYDADRGSDLIPTLRVWLDNFGDVRAASAAMQVHANTFRYRLRRVMEVGEIDPDDLAGRFDLMVQLRLLDTHGA